MHFVEHDPARLVEMEREKQLGSDADQERNEKGAVPESGKAVEHGAAINDQFSRVMPDLVDVPARHPAKQAI
ncbi:hypothetical protein [Sphingomonas sp. S2-65]|uniref:hypothetical protein n=1 Tax=Sphingomonas sp. S2-65 TaxID=2903960 RepID=UPI001F1D5E9C|nr:hypothetical protein [Sphingomonas sp. S2-65]UYY59900.1 hypothetical protein LZ586_07390 [Sphingomonas sp. S2-65]